MTIFSRFRRALTAVSAFVALVAVPGLTSDLVLSHASAAVSCAGPFPSLDAQTGFAGTQYGDRGYTLNVAPLDAHPSIWQFGLSLPPRHGERLGDAYYGYAYAVPSQTGARLCSIASATYVPANPYGGQSPHSVGLRLDGVVDTVHLTARVTILVAGRTIVINESDPGVAPAQVRAATRAMGRFVTTLNERCWAASYAMLDPRARKYVTENAYAGTLGRVFMSIAVEGRGVPRSAHMSDAIMGSAGAQAGYIQRVRVQLRHPNGGQYVHQGIVEFILLRGEWYLGATDDWTR
jgi:hypothetical protein